MILFFDTDIQKLPLISYPASLIHSREYLCEARNILSIVKDPIKMYTIQVKRAANKAHLDSAVRKIN